VGLAQKAAGSQLIYGFFEPLEAEAGALLFGPFVNRNHFAGYMLMVVPICMSVAMRAYGRYRRRVGGRAGWLRSWAVALQSPEGIDFVYALVPALAGVAALIAANSRGGLMAFLGGMAIAVIAFRGRVGVAGVVPMALVVMGLSWFGLERIGDRFMTAFDDSVGRTAVWQDSIARIDGYWLAGSGLNTFAVAMSRTSAWRLPEGATPWRPEEAMVVHAPQMGYRVPEGIERWLWYREAHNDYVQVFVEMGLIGLAITLWAAVAVLRRVAPDPWLLAAVTGIMLHSLVDFDLQIPALAVLFAVITAMPAMRSARRATPAGDRNPERG
jgi:O-antigen ligase